MRAKNPKSYSRFVPSYTAHNFFHVILIDTTPYTTHTCTHIEVHMHIMHTHPHTHKVITLAHHASKIIQIPTCEKII